jgi:hypothetical protein
MPTLPRIGSFQGSTLFYAADNFQQLWRCDVGNRITTYPGEYIPFKTADADDAVSMIG